MEPNDDAELSRVLREWQAPEAPAWLEGRMLAARRPTPAPGPEAPAWLEGRALAPPDARHDARHGACHAARWRGQFAAGLALAAVLAAAAWLLVRQPAPPPAAAMAVQDEDPFVPVPNVLPLDSYETGRVLRMDVPVSALLAAGYRVPMADPAALVAADVLVGEDGRAHAVRLLSGMTLNTKGE